MHSKILPIILISAIVAVAGCAQQPAETTEGKSSSSTSRTENNIVVNDQPINGGTVTVSRVLASGAGWVVIHAQTSEGSPGAVLGYAQVSSGANTNVAVKIDSSKATAALYAMLHKDAGQKGVFEYPGADAPVTVGEVVGEPVSHSFKVTA